MEQDGALGRVGGLVERLAQLLRADGGEGTAPAIKRIGADQCVAEREIAARGGFAVDDEIAPAADEVAHAEHLAGRLGPGAVRPRMKPGQVQGDLVEDLRIEDRLAQFEFDFRQGDGDGEVAIVAREDAVLEVAEVAAGGRVLVAVRFRLARFQAVMLGEIEDAGVLFFFPDIGAFLDELVEGEAALAGGVDDDIGGEGGLGAVLLTGDAGDIDDAVRCLGRDETADEETGADGHVTERFDIAAHGELERRAAAGDESEFLILRLGRVERLLRRGQHVVECQFTDTEGFQLLQQLGMLGLHDGAQARQEGVALAHMADARAAPVAEKLVRVLAFDRAVPFQQCDGAPARGQHQGRAEAGNPGADDDDCFGF